MQKRITIILIIQINIKYETSSRCISRILRYYRKRYIFK